MRFVAAIFFALALTGLALPAHADINQIQAREVARNNNCPVKKIAVYQASVGAQGKTIFKIDCNMPKTDDANAPKGADALLVACQDNMCELMRPVAGESK